jgi:hypothetical protein
MKTALRFLGVLVRNPVEAADRLRNRLAHLDGRVGTHPRKPYIDEPAWEERLHAALGAGWPCHCSEQADEVLSQLRRECPPVASGSGHRHDADSRLARAVWATAVHVRPARVIETGVARGIVSRVVLEAMEHNGTGQLWSIDLPPLHDPWWRESRAAVPRRLYSRWNYIRQDVKRALPKIASRGVGVDLFIHDSLHTAEHMSFEFRHAARLLRSAGVLIADDIQSNDAFAALPGTEWTQRFSVHHEEKDGFFGVAIRA